MQQRHTANNKTPPPSQISLYW